MVIPDWSARPRPPKFDGTHEAFDRPIQLARPTDRLAAVIVDVFVILTPIFVLLGSPVKPWLTTSFVVSSDSDLFLSIALLSLLAIVLLVGYQTIGHHVFGATFGKRLFGLKVESVFAQEVPTFWDCFFRALVWVFELLCLGLPWLSVFSDSRRRPLHDRVSNTVVVTRALSGVNGPALWHRGLVRGFYSSILLMIGLGAVVEFIGLKDKMSLEHALLGLSEKETPRCDTVTPYVSEDSQDEHARLKMAMSLYAAGLTERSCLASEVERETSMKIPLSPLTYLAQAFVYAENAEISNSYLDEVCKDAPDSVECSMSQLVSSWSDDNWAGVEDIIRSAPLGSGYLEIWGVRHYMNQAEYADALTLLDGLIGRREIGEFSLVQRVKALYNVYHESEAQAALAQAIVALPHEDSLDLSAWMCAQQLQNGCEALSTSLACKQLPKIPEMLNFANPPETLAQVLSMECKSGASVDYLELSEQTENESWRIFFRANLKRQREDRSASAALYSKVIAASSTPEILRTEATRRLMQFASPRQLESVVKMWSEFKSKEAWVKTGNILFSRLAEQKNPELALRVARHLMNSHQLSPQGMSTLTAMVETTPPGSIDRRPANVKVRDQVRQLLDHLGGGQ